MKIVRCPKCHQLVTEKIILGTVPLLLERLPSPVYISNLDHKLVELNPQHTPAYALHNNEKFCNSLKKEQSQNG